MGRKRPRGGYDVPLAGRPERTVHRLPMPDALLIPLRTARLDFRQVLVSAGDDVRPRTPLAVAPGTWGLPLASPCAGRVIQVDAGKTITLAPAAESAEDEGAGTPGADEPGGRDRLVASGAWSWVSDARDGSIPDPGQAPAAVIVSTSEREPFLPRGSTFLSRRLDDFLDGLEQIQGLLEYQRIFLLVPHVDTELADRVLSAVRGRAYVHVHLIPLRYPFGDPRLALHDLDIRGDGPVWALDVQGVLVWREVLRSGRAGGRRIVTVGGPAVERPAYYDVPVGYPLGKLFEAAGAAESGAYRAIRGGVMRGDAVSAHDGVDVEARGYTLVSRPPAERELLSFLRPGFDRASYSRCWLSRLRAARPESLTTAMRGEPRACVNCGLCEQVCPVGILPHLIHRALYRDALEEAEWLRIDRCIGCGLCSYVCPSKIDLRQQFQEARDRIQEELHSEPEEAE